MGDNVFVALAKVESELTLRINALEQRDAEIRSTLVNLRSSMSTREKALKVMNDNLAIVCEAYNHANTTWRDNFTIFMKAMNDYLASIGHSFPADVMDKILAGMKVPDHLAAVKKLEVF